VFGFFMYLRVSQTEPGDSYGAVFTLQGWDMLHGNLLLHGWSLSDVSFYTTELPEYLLVDAARGLSPDVVHICAAITFTLLLIASGLLAKGTATGKAAVIRVLLAIGIMCAPQLGNGVFVLLGAPDHVGTCVPVLLVWLILDRARPRWYVPVVVGILLAWVLVADSVVLLTAVLPLAVVCTIRFYRRVVQQGADWRSQWYELSLIAAALAAEGVATKVLTLIRAHGGFYVNPVGPYLSTITALPGHLLLLLEGTLLLFGADFLGQRLAVSGGLVLLHLVGLALAIWAVRTALHRYLDLDLVDQVLVVAILINMVGFLLWAPAGDITTTREIATVLPYGAVLAARLLADRLAAARLMPALSVVLAGYVVALASVALHPPQPPQDQQLTSWLVARHFHYGIGTSWVGNLVTASSGQRVQLRPVAAQHHMLMPSRWEAVDSWYNPRLHDATFAVLAGYPLSKAALSDWRITFGPPVRTYHADGFTILRWDENLLARLR
jgi:hypothetical protein